MKEKIKSLVADYEMGMITLDGVYHQVCNILDTECMKNDDVTRVRDVFSDILCDYDNVTRIIVEEVLENIDCKCSEKNRGKAKNLRNHMDAIIDALVL